MTDSESTTSLEARCREVLQMWLRWNEASQQVTELMFRERENPEKLREMLDDLDRQRLEAVTASRQLLDS
ncbi:MAG TPA: hypothetical protein VNH11_19720 [Pirellulales bacterium]|nr:hypothetical protein [Pirellulales bacterium]